MLLKSCKEEKAAWKTRMNQDRMRWRDREMWVDVREKTIVTTLEALLPKALAILHFPLEKTQQHENRPTKEREFTALLIQNCSSHVKTNMQPSLTVFATTWMHVQKCRQDHLLCADT